MTCTAFYRTYGGENNAHRPAWYSKELCLRSFLQALSILRRNVETGLVVLHDGSLDDNRAWSDRIGELLVGVGTILELPKTNNAVSCLDALKRASDLDVDMALVLAEDDYLWLPQSLHGMIAALTAVPADYVTGYDHPVRYQLDYPRGADWPHWDTYLYFAGGHHWRTQESTCMTFATRVRTLQEDLNIFEEHHNNGKNYPDDRTLFRHLQGLGDFTISQRRRLVGPIPSLNTHAHLPWLAPGVDWDGAAGAVGARCEV